jgi:HTH-type transcriptional regulator/antitoxin HigA
MSKYLAPIAIHPGETLREVLESKKMSQAELSERIGLHTKTINEIIKGKKPISPNTALKLSFVFGTSENFWNTLQKNYDETVARLEFEKELEDGKEIVPNFSAYSQLVKFELVKRTLKPKERAESLLAFFGVASFGALDKIYSFENIAFRSSNKQKISFENLKAWLRFGEIESEKIETNPFSLEKLKEELEALS